HFYPVARLQAQRFRRSLLRLTDGLHRFASEEFRFDLGNQRHPEVLQRLAETDIPRKILCGAALEGNRKLIGGCFAEFGRLAKVLPRFRDCCQALSALDRLFCNGRSAVPISRDRLEPAFFPHQCAGALAPIMRRAVTAEISERYRVRKKPSAEPFHASLFEPAG